MCIVHIVRRADRHIVNFLPAATLLIDVSIEPFEFDEKVCIRKIAVDDANRIFRIKGDREAAANLLDRSHVTRRDVTRSSNKRKSKYGPLLRRGHLADALLRYSNLLILYKADNARATVRLPD